MEQEFKPPVGATHYLEMEECPFYKLEKDVWFFHGQAGWIRSQYNHGDLLINAKPLPQPSTEKEMDATIRYSSDGTMCMVWQDGKPVRCPTQDDMDALPVGDDMTEEELAQLSD